MHYFVRWVTYLTVSVTFGRHGLKFVVSIHHRTAIPIQLSLTLTSQIQTQFYPNGFGTWLGRGLELYYVMEWIV